MKNGTTNNRKIIYFAAAALIFAALCPWLFGGRARSLDGGRPCSIVILGDSVMGLGRDETSVPAKLSELLGKEVFNGAFGGTCLSFQTQDMYDNYTMSLLNMVSLSKSIAADDFGVQQTVRAKREITYYFGDTVDELDAIDFGRVDTLVFQFGINDYHAGVPIDNESDPFDESTYCGAFRSAVRTLREAYPDMRLVYVTPTYTWYLSNGLTCEEYDTGEAFLEEYVSEGLKAAGECGVEALDLYHDFYPHDKWEDWQLYTEDGLHPNETGRRMIAERLAEALGR